MNMVPATKLLEWLGAAIGWAWKRPRLVLEGALVAALVVGGWLHNRTVRELQEAIGEAQGLEAGLRQQLTLKQNELETVTRDLTGKIIIKKVFVPPEGYVVIKKADMEATRKEYLDTIEKLKTASGKEREDLLRRLKELEGKLDQPDEIIVKKEGWTFKPGFGMEWANRGLKPCLDFKFAYWDRYSLILGGSENGAGVGASRHLDDLLWFHPKNVEWFIRYQFLRFNGSAQVATGARVNF
jgi:hypothetical protein